MTPEHNWGYLLDQLCGQVPGISHAMAVTADGLKLALSRGLPADRADQLAAITSGLASLTNGAADLMGAAPVEQNVTEMADGYLIVMAIGDGSSLTVLATKHCDLGQVTYEMAVLINRVGGALVPAPRTPHRS
ncbi:roadblock/LC7 domain-containing protein [Micromonospora sp. CPCC 206061]|uniref:roadblock/LC7 domain-containing protein n=1 Tax=Micromonospora sp. CPCC 206061 TaxID=3122410 RepID=UPI002FF0B329